MGENSTPLRVKPQGGGGGGGEGDLIFVKDLFLNASHKARKYRPNEVKSLRCVIVSFISTKMI